MIKKTRVKVDGKIKYVTWILCDVCKQVNFETFMVTDQTWKEAGFKPDQEAHLDCFLQKLNRPIKFTDFTKVRCNNLFWLGATLT
jgi:hypothetical protein